MFSRWRRLKEQMVRLRSEYGFCGTQSSHLCVAALNENNIGYARQPITKVVCDPFGWRSPPP